jgi:hypothetical protein
MVLVAMRGDNRVELALGAFPDVVRDLHHAVRRHARREAVEPKSISTWRSAPP